MRRCALFAIVIFMSTVVAETAAQTLPAPHAVTDPKQISSKPNAQLEPRSLTIETLYMTRQVGRATWSPDGKWERFCRQQAGAHWGFGPAPRLNHQLTIPAHPRHDPQAVTYCADRDLQTGLTVSEQEPSLTHPFRCPRVQPGHSYRAARQG